MKKTNLLFFCMVAFISCNEEQDLNLSVNQNNADKEIVLKNTHKIIDIADEGLIPITEFILEENIKQKIQDLIENGLNKIDFFQEPYIKLRMTWTNGQAANWQSIMVTRANDYIIIKEDFIVGDQNTYYNAEVNRLSKIYGLKIKLGHQKDSNETNFKEIDETKMKKFIDTEHSTTYLLYSEGDKKYAYSIHYDYLLDTYAIRDFVNSLPDTKISIEELFNYTIVAL